MGREETPLADNFLRLDLRCTVKELFAEQFECQKCRMPLIHMIHCRMKTERAQHPHATDAENDFLANARIDITSIRERGQATKILGILRNVGIEKIDGTAADIDPPNLEMHRAVSYRHAANKRLPKEILDEFDRNESGIRRGITFLLVAVGIDMLLEIALTVKQTDADQGESDVAGRFHMVSGEDA